MRSHLAVTIAAAVCGALCVSAVASATVTIGGDITAADPPIGCGGGPDNPAACDIAQTALVRGQAAAPFDGVVVRWRAGGATGPLALRVVRPAAFTYTFISTSVVETPVSTGVEAFATRQPIRAGDDVGVELGPGSRIGAMDPAPADDMLAAWLPLGDGQSAPAVLYRTGFSIAYNADVEPDADHDGFGDETQDGCPSDASSQGVCPAPAPAPAPAPDRTSAASAPLADNTPAAVSASARSVRLSKGGSISFFVTASENATALVTGTVRVRRPARSVRLAKRNVTLTAGRPAKVTLRLSKTGAAVVRRALANHDQLKAAITLSVEDAAGNPSATRLSLRLKR
jgi:hypothetical protein